MKKFTTMLNLLLIFAGSSLANNPPDGVSTQEWGKIKQQIKQQMAVAKYYPQVAEEGLYTAYNSVQNWQMNYAKDGMTTIKNSNYRIGMKLQSIGNLQLNTTPRIEVKDDTLYYHHSPKIKEWWVNSATKVEQWFSIKQRPITGSHELKVQIELDTDTVVSQSSNQLSFTTQKGQSINYDKLKVWDSRGTILSSRMQLADNSKSFALIVDDRLAHYPITIDPSFSQSNYIKPLVVDEDDFFGYSVDVDGDTMVVGAPYEDSSSTSINGNSNDNNAPDSGAAYVFTRSGATWTQQAYLKASNAEADEYFGRSVSISGDSIVIGADYEDGDASSTDNTPNNNATDAGAAYVFTRNGSSWTQQAYLKANNAEAFHKFGYSVAISADSIVVGAYAEDGDASSSNGAPNNNAAFAGAAYVFTRSGTTWTQQAYLKASNAEAGDYFGSSIAIFDDSIVVGAYLEDGDASSTQNIPNNFEFNAGAVYVYTRSGTTWTQQAYLKASNAEENDKFGFSVAISDDSTFVGAFLEGGDADSTDDTPNNNASGAGAAYVFTRSGTTWTQQAYLKTSNAEAGDNFGHSIAASNNIIVVGAHTEEGDASSTSGTPNNNAPSAGAAYVFTRNGLTWTEQAYLKASNAEINDKFGFSVAITDNSIFVGAYLEDGDADSTDNTPNNNASSAGALYTFNDTDAYLIGGSVTGLAAPGLILQNNGSDDLNINSNGGFVFSQPLFNGSNFMVTASNQPNNQSCTVINGTGTITSADVIDVGINCIENSYFIGVSIAGLTGPGLVLQNNGGDDLSITSNGNTPFSNQLIDGDSFNVSIFSQPNDPSNLCELNGTHSGTVAGGHVAVSVICGHDIIFFDGFE